MKGQRLEDLDPVEQDVRRALPVGMIDGKRLTIEFVSEFEGFGSYETWAQGWRITDHETFDGRGRELMVMGRHLDDAIKAWVKKRDRLLEAPDDR